MLKNQCFLHRFRHRASGIVVQQGGEIAQRLIRIKTLLFRSSAIDEVESKLCCCGWIGDRRWLQSAAAVAGDAVVPPGDFGAILWPGRGVVADELDSDFRNEDSIRKV